MNTDTLGKLVPIVHSTLRAPLKDGSAFSPMGPGGDRIREGVIFPCHCGTWNPAAWRDGGLASGGEGSCAETDACLVLGDTCLLVPSDSLTGL